MRPGRPNLKLGRGAREQQPQKLTVAPRPALTRQDRPQSGEDGARVRPERKQHVTACFFGILGDIFFSSTSVTIMASAGPAGPLRFRTPHIEELPTVQSRQAPGFAWVQSAAPSEDPAKNWGTNNRKRARSTAGGQTESQREALSARQQREIERKIKELNNDNSKDVSIPLPKKEAGAPGGARAGKTTNTKKILASGKTFAHYLDDEEAEIARTGRRDGDLEIQPPIQQRASKTPLARRRAREDSSVSGSPAPPVSVSQPVAQGLVQARAPDIEDEEDGAVAAIPSEVEMEALLNAPALTYNQARSAPPPASAPPPRRFCEVCGYFGRAKCMKCGAMTCSVVCKDLHDEQRCLKFYA